MEARDSLRARSATSSSDAILAQVTDELCTLSGSHFGFLVRVDQTDSSLVLQQLSADAQSTFPLTAAKLPVRIDADPMLRECEEHGKAITHSGRIRLPWQNEGEPLGESDGRLLVPLFDGLTVVAVFGVCGRKKPYSEADTADVTALANEFWSIARERSAAESLERNERELSWLYRTVASPVFTVTVGENDHFRFADINDAFLRATGLPRERIVGREVWEVIPAEAHGIVRDGYRTAIEGHQTASWEEISEYPSGKRYGVVSVHPIFDASGHCTHLVGTAHDITDRTRAEEKADFSERQYRALFENSMDAILLTSPDGSILEANSAACHLFGRTEAEIVARGRAGLVSLTDPGLGVLLEERKLHGKAIGEVTFLRADGSSFPAEVSSALFEVGEGNIRTSMIVRDLTARRKSELEREQLQNELLQAQKMESIGRLAGGVAHDFNNILTVILGHAEVILMDKAPGEPLYDEIEQIRIAARRSTDLTRRLLAFARRQTIAPRVLDLNQVIAGMLTMIGRLIGEDIELSWQPGSALWPISFDPVQIDQILTNLCVNARDAIERNGRILIETRNVTTFEPVGGVVDGPIPGAYVALTVSDNGSGMDKETLNHMFEPFFTTKEPGAGTGLGTATVYGIVKQNNGFINVESEPGQGTTFRIYIPRHTAESETDIATTGPAPERGRGETILLVEDEPDILIITRRMLERLGYHVLAASGPDEALQLSAEHEGNIPILITDVIMPHMNGKDLSVELQKSRPEMKTLFVSGYTADVIARHGVLEEGVEFIEKPYAIETLAQRTRELLDRT